MRTILVSSCGLKKSHFNSRVSLHEAPTEKRVGGNRSKERDRKCRSEAKRRDVPYGHASMLLLGEGSEATEPYNNYDKIRPHSIRSLQFDQKVRPLSSRPKKIDLFTATHKISFESYGLFLRK